MSGIGITSEAAIQAAQQEGISMSVEDENRALLGLLEDAEHALVISGKCYCPGGPPSGLCAKCEALREIAIVLEGKRTKGTRGVTG